MDWIFLSHRLSNNTPQYGGEKAIYIEQRTSLAKGDSSNTKFLQLPNHVGTHIDFPKHFHEEGKTLNDYDAVYWVFSKPFVLDYYAADDELIDLKGIVERIPYNTDFLLIKTGYQKYRGEIKYWNNNPGLSPELANDLRNHCPNLKAVGFDFISLTSYQNRLIGREAHRQFLIDNDIVIIEDMDLSAIPSTLTEIIALPLMIDNIDGGPITVIAKY